MPGGRVVDSERVVGDRHVAVNAAYDHVLKLAHTCVFARSEIGYGPLTLCFLCI